ncbi:hypothetical protein GCM10007856_01340 [Azospirillum oryzae]|nr:hypothetical protein GCM10007856_01340 [Azospirillum oryzae]
MTGMRLFASIPDLPVVPPPAPGEALGGWVEAIADLYGLSRADYLKRLGVPRRWVTEAINRDLVFRPLPSVMARLQVDTGIAEEVLRGMTFTGLDRPLEEVCRNHYVPCPECAYEAERQADRPVELLFARAAWRVVCPLHPPDLDPGDVVAGVPLPAFYDQVRHVIGFLDRAAFDRTLFQEVVGTRLAPAYSVDVFLWFVYLLNSFLRVEVSDIDTMRECCEFRILDAYDTNADLQPVPLPAEERNGLAVSLVLAWQLLAAPFTTLFAGLRTTNQAGRKTRRDEGQFMAVIRMLLEFWPGEILAIPMTGGALSVRWPPKETVATRTAQALAKPWSNHASYAERLAEAHWNHTAWVRALLADRSLVTGPHHVSHFPWVGPFHYRPVASNTRSASRIDAARQAARNKRNLGLSKRPGLPRFSETVIRRARRPSTAPPHQPAPCLTISPHIVDAVRQVLEAHGPLPKKLRARERRALMRKLSAAATKLLASQAEGGLTMRQATTE